MKSFKLFILLLSGITLLFSCGKPTTPETVPVPDITGGYKIVTKYQTTGYAQDVIEKDNLLYMAQGEGGLEIIDITNPEAPQTLSITSDGARGYSAKVAVKDSAVYLAAGSFGVTTINASDPFAPEVPGSNSTEKPAKGLHIMGDYLFVAVSEQGVKYSDISIPIYPDSKGQISTSGFAYGLTTSSDSAFMFVACGEMGMYIFDISDIEQGWYHEVAFCNTPGKAEQVILLEEKSIAFMACGTSGLQIIDYADTSNVHIIGSFDGGGYAKDLLYDTNDRIYLSTELSGLQIIDVSDLSNPKLIGEIDTEFSLGIDMDNDYIYLADEREGLIVIAKPN